LHSVSEWQRDKVDWSEKNADFFTLTGCHGNIPSGIKKEVQIGHIQTNTYHLVQWFLR